MANPDDAVKMASPIQIHAVPRFAFESRLSPSTRLASFPGSWPDTPTILWDPMDYTECLGILDGHSGPILSVSVSPDNQTLVSGSQDGTIRVWDIRKVMQSMETHWTNSALLKFKASFLGQQRSFMQIIWDRQIATLEDDPYGSADVIFSKLKAMVSDDAQTDSGEEHSNLYRRSS